ncbi:Cobalt-precorrin-3B C(17)-methyltransferase [Aedoeadaptatus ivorii]|uniref:Cobalt-precorrin-3B C(17)-methyltransferase n=1 Tax=Aedoeadaptatus ivorii TaxID=54006 RepID=A0A448V141_9FIRM|nr:precorrin-3B C(17)-methyltransferase [Peptoniphilus ivorii]VEJ35449.1 Cobalt-precorrin-3B C(17)-methyltransferase [Peptoniphilus ivorii]
MKKLYVIGIGPGGSALFTDRMRQALEESEVVVGYTPYLGYIRHLIENKTLLSTGMKSEIERCKMAVESASSGRTTAIVSTGDAGLYGMAGPILEIAAETDIEVEIIPGVSANFAAASRVGAPLMHDTATISLSDLMTPLSVIEKRIRYAAAADFVISLYNPRSKGRAGYLSHAFSIMKEEGYGPDRPVAVVKNAWREGEEIHISTMDAVDIESVDMNTIVIVGNCRTYIEGGKMITPRGYDL